MIKIIVSLGIALGVPIAFYVPVKILFPTLLNRINTARNHYTFSELLFRTGCLAVVLLVAEFVPNFSLLLSLIGSVCCTMLAFILPVVAELVIANNSENGIPMVTWVKDGFILTIGFVGMLLGGGTSLVEMFE